MQQAYIGLVTDRAVSASIQLQCPSAVLFQGTAAATLYGGKWHLDELAQWVKLHTKPPVTDLQRDGLGAVLRPDGYVGLIFALPESTPELTGWRPLSEYASVKVNIEMPLVSL